MTPSSIRLFIKPGCPWCDEAIEWLEDHEITYEEMAVVREQGAGLGKTGRDHA